MKNMSLISALPNNPESHNSTIAAVRGGSLHSWEIMKAGGDKLCPVYFSSVAEGKGELWWVEWTVQSSSILQPMYPIPQLPEC